jgi:glycosyltransferase involved in cell wall biosynthesis
LPERFFRAQADEIAFGFQASAWMARRSIDVWHALGTADAAGATLLGHPMKFRSVHTSLGLPEKGYWNGRPDRFLHEFVAAHVDSYICLSKASAAGLRAGWSRSADVVSGGVDIDRFTPAASRHDRPALLYSGTLTEERKNLRLLLEAVAILRVKHPHLELWLSGPGDPSALIAASPPAAQGAVVHLGLGSPQEQGLRYGRAWVTVLPSEHEALGLCLIESLACGTPVVALADGGGPAELIQPGIGIASGSTSAELADACGLAIELVHLPGTAEACRAASERYDWRRSVVPRLEEIYRCQSPRS